MPGNDQATGQVWSNDGACSHLGFSADGDPGQKPAATGDGGGEKDPGSFTPEFQGRAAVAHSLVIERHHPGAAENFVFDDDAAREIAAALQRDELADADVSLDVHVGADAASRADDHAVANEDKISDSRSRPDLGIVRDERAVSVCRGRFHVWQADHAFQCVWRVDFGTTDAARSARREFKPDRKQTFTKSIQRNSAASNRRLKRLSGSRSRTGRTRRHSPRSTASRRRPRLRGADAKVSTLPASMSTFSARISTYRTSVVTVFFIAFAGELSGRCATQLTTTPP